MPPESRILLDECVPTQLRRFFPDGRDVQSAQYAGLKGLKNGRLVSAMKGRFDVLLTLDAGLASEQNIVRAGIVLITLASGDDDLSVLRRYVPVVLARLDGAEPGESIWLDEGDLPLPVRPEAPPWEQQGD